MQTFTDRQSEVLRMQALSSLINALQFRKMLSVWALVGPYLTLLLSFPLSSLISMDFIQTIYGDVSF